MEELKTLKDLSSCSFTNRSDGGSDFMKFAGKKSIPRGGINDYLIFDEVKEEAIKWIKELDTLSVSGDCHYNKIDKIFDYSCMACSDGRGMCGAEIIINFIKHFFNITEEDLE